MALGPADALDQPIAQEIDLIGLDRSSAARKLAILGLLGWCCLNNTIIAGGIPLR